MEAPIKFVKKPSNYIVCSVCRNIFSNPVINVKCGHTFCLRCIEGTDDCKNDQLIIRCPEDGTECKASELIVNRAIEGEVTDQEVYCRFGLQWSDEANDFITDPTGCAAVIKYGSIQEHESLCDFAIIECPNGDSQRCGLHRRRSIQKHLDVCLHVPCPHRNKGCTFVDNLSEVLQHSSVCQHRNNQVISGVDQRQLDELLKSHNALEDKVETLTQRVKHLEDIKLSQSVQLETHTMLLHQLCTKMDEMHSLLLKLTPVSSSSSPLSPTRDLSTFRRSAFSQSFDDNFTMANVVKSSRSHDTLQRVPYLSLSPGLRVETWNMPFQFKCIGTLRSHKGGVWNLQTYKKRVFSCASDCNIKVWDLDDLVHGCKHSFIAHTGRVHVMTVNSRHLYSAGDDLAIKSWHLNDLSLHECVENAHDQLIAALTCTEEVLISSSYTIIKIWNSLTLEHVHSIDNLHHWVRSLAINPIMTELYSGSHGIVDIWELKSGKFGLSGRITHTHGSVYALAVTCQYIIVGTYNQNMHVFDVRSRQYLVHLTGHVGIINSIVTSPSGRFMFSSSSDASVMVWSLEKMLPIQTLQRHNDSVNALVVNGDLLLTGSEDTEVKVFKYFRMQMGFVSS